METAPLADNWGAIVNGHGAGTLDRVRGPALIDLFKTKGALLFRGFGITDGEFQSFTEAHGGSFLANLHARQEREMVADQGRTATVNLGNKLVGFHSEMSYSPLRPELLWFHCVRPAAQHGQTLLADGIELWEKMAPSLKRVFEKRVRYRFPRAPRDLWPVFTGAWTDRPAAMAALERLPGVRCALAPGDTLDIEYLTPAAPPTRFGGMPAFVNSIVVLEVGAVDFEDGTPITQEMQLELLALGQELSTPIEWEAGDLVMIDNTRMMHGRMPFSDRERRIHVRMGKAAF